MTSCQIISYSGRKKNRQCTYHAIPLHFLLAHPYVHQPLSIGGHRYTRAIPAMLSCKDVSYSHLLYIYSEDSPIEYFHYSFYKSRAHDGTKVNTARDMYLSCYIMMHKALGIASWRQSLFLLSCQIPTRWNRHYDNRRGTTLKDIPA